MFLCGIELVPYTFATITDVNKEQTITLQKIAFLCGLFMIVNSLQFLIHIIVTWQRNVPMPLWYIPGIVHVILPILVYICFYYYIGINLNQNYGRVKHWVFGLLFIGYTFALLWQSYCISLVSFMLFFILKIYYTPTTENLNNRKS